MTRIWVLLVRKARNIWAQDAGLRRTTYALCAIGRRSMPRPGSPQRVLLVPHPSEHVPLPRRPQGSYALWTTCLGGKGSKKAEMGPTPTVGTAQCDGRSIGRMKMVQRARQ